MTIDNDVEKKIDLVIHNKVIQHWKLHEQPIPLAVLSKRFGRQLKVLDIDASLYFDLHQDLYFVCHTSSYRIFIFPKEGWATLDPILKEKWLMA